MYGAETVLKSHPHLHKTFTPFVQPRSVATALAAVEIFRNVTYINPVHHLTMYFFKIKFNIILPSMSKSSTLISRPKKNSVYLWIFVMLCSKESP